MEITHQKCREIQAPMVSSLIYGFAREIGFEKAIEIAKNVIRQDAVASGKKSAQEYSGNTLAELSKIVKEVWAKDSALTLEMLKENETTLFFDVTHCKYAQMYVRMGIEDIGFILSCNRDFSFMEGFNPQIELKRTKTIMEGAECCDFRFSLRG
jgi:hypothetical protein